MTTTVMDRFWAKVNQAADGCWLWTAATNGRPGYGVFTPVRSEGQRLAHRFSYETFVGPIPEGLQIDHLCRVRLCVNPAHLEAVTPGENLARSSSDWRPWQAAGAAANGAKKRSLTHCKRGHKFTRENTAIVPGGRNCRKCAVIHSQNYQRRRREHEA